MNDEQHNHNLSLFAQGEANLFAMIRISLRDENQSVISCPIQVDINKRPLRFSLELDKSALCEKFSSRIDKWQKNNKQEADIRISDCSFEGFDVNVNIKGSGILFHSVSFDVHTQTKMATFTMNHLTFSYVTDNSECHTYYRLTEVANILEGDLNSMDIRGGKILQYNYIREFNLGEDTFMLFYELHKNSMRVFIETDGDIRKICSLLSFYIGAVIEWDMKISDNNGIRAIELNEPYYKNQILNPCNEPLHYITANKECLDHLNTIQSGIIVNSTDIDGALSQCIELYVRATLLDIRSQFITYYSILEKTLDDEEQNEMEISQYLTCNNIDYDKLSCGIASLEINNHVGEKIENIRQLRNEILHHIGSSKIDKFMRESEIITRMQYAACILILWQMGFKKIQFIRPWEHLSIFKDNVESYDYFKDKNLL